MQQALLSNSLKVLVAAISSLVLIAVGLAACGSDSSISTPERTVVPTDTPMSRPTLILTPTSVPTSTPLPRAASVTVSPNAVKPGGNIDILGAGFLPGEVQTVELIGALQGDNITLAADVVANSYGAFTTSATVSSSSTPGVFTLRVSGSLSSVATTPLVIAKESK